MPVCLSVCSDPNGQTRPGSSEIQIPEDAVEGCRNLGDPLASACEYDWVTMDGNVSRLRGLRRGDGATHWRELVEDPFTHTQLTLSKCLLGHFLSGIGSSTLFCCLQWLAEMKEIIITFGSINTNLLLRCSLQTKMPWLATTSVNRQSMHFFAFELPFI